MKTELIQGAIHHHVLIASDARDTCFDLDEFSSDVDKCLVVLFDCPLLDCAM